MREIADQAAGVPATILNLEERGFYVRVGAGDPDDAVRRSNAWGSDRHIALHSNALGGCPSPTGGTIVFNYHGSGPGSFLAQELVDQLGPESPGDETDYRDPIPDPDVEDDMDLYELRETMMPAAYVETAFHDHNPDQNWLDSDEDFIAYLISLAVDDHLGYP